MGLLEFFGAVGATGGSVFEELELLALEEVLAIVAATRLLLLDDEVAAEVAHLNAGRHLLRRLGQVHTQQSQQLVFVDRDLSVCHVDPV